MLILKKKRLNDDILLQIKLNEPTCQDFNQFFVHQVMFFFFISICFIYNMLNTTKLSLNL